MRGTARSMFPPARHMCAPSSPRRAAMSAPSQIRCGQTVSDEELHLHHGPAAMTRERVGVGVVGVGIMGRRHAENAARWIPGARLAAVFDADRVLAARVGRDLDADACGSLEELLGRDDVRVVVIASPREFHAEQAVAALSRGRDVLLEKPMALSLTDCDRVIAAAEQGSGRLQIGFMRRYDPAYAEAKRLLVSGALGEALLVRAVHRDREAPDLPESRGVTDMMLESTIHDFDLSRFLLDDE